MSHIGVLIIHGILGSPREFNFLASQLQAHGYQTRQVTLPGHGKQPSEALKEVTAETMRAHCLDEYARLASSCDEVVIIGHSLGGICALLIAAAQPVKLKGVMTFSAPCDSAYFINYPQGLRHLSKKHWLRGLSYLPQSYTRYEKPDFKLGWVSHLKRQTETIFELLEMALPQINVPACLTHSEFDMAIPYGEMHKLARGLTASPDIRTHTLSQCGHQIFAYGREQQNATRIVLDFLQECCTEVPSPSQQIVLKANRICRIKIRLQSLPSLSSFVKVS